ncbi:MAG: hypothetical protein QOE22_424 [Candidatus Parcubacteria bacterium]|jgi:hypothetical protein|nr:hypothetical protein [Candidatus Parcubacteria bacterium]
MVYVMNKERVISVVSVLVVCALLFGAYAVLRKPRPTGSESVIPVPERIASTTVPFVTYSNTALGVSFSVPQDWKQVPGNTVRIESPNFAEEAVPGTNEKRVTAGAALSLEKEAFLIDSSEEYAALIEELHNSPECTNCLTGHRITIGSVAAHMGFASTGTPTEPNGAIISFVAGGNRYRLLMSFASYTPANQEILAEIIHTFAFTQ